MQVDESGRIQVVVGRQGLVDENCGHAREFRREDIVSSQVSESSQGLRYPFVVEWVIDRAICRR